VHNINRSDSINETHSTLSETGKEGLRTQLLFTFCEFVLGSLADSRGYSKNKSTSPRPLSGQQHQNVSTIRSYLQAISHYVQVTEYKKAAHITVFLQR